MRICLAGSRPRAAHKGVFADLDGGVVVQGDALELILVRGVHVNDQLRSPANSLAVDGSSKTSAILSI